MHSSTLPSPESRITHPDNLVTWVRSYLAREVEQAPAACLPGEVAVEGALHALLVVVEGAVDLLHQEVVGVVGGGGWPMRSATWRWGWWQWRCLCSYNPKSALCIAFFCHMADVQDMIYELSCGTSKALDNSSLISNRFVLCKNVQAHAAVGV